MSIRNRIEDAIFLWQNDHFEGALLSVLIAVAATARLRFPDRDKINDKEAFEKFLNESSKIKTKVEFRGECRPIENIFYKWLRCELVHEGTAPPDIKFVPSKEPNALMIRAGGAPEYTLKLSDNWFQHLVGIVIQSPENKGVFEDLKGK